MIPPKPPLSRSEYEKKHKTKTEQINLLFEEVLKHHVKVAGLRAVYRRHFNDIVGKNE